MKRRSWALILIVTVVTLVAFLLLYKMEEQVVIVSRSVEEPRPSEVSRATPAPPLSQTVEATAPRVADAMSPRKERSPKSSPETNFFSFERGKLATTSWLMDTRWKLWVGVSALDKKKGRPSGKILGEVSGYYLVEESLGHESQSFSSHQPLVVMDPRLKVAGVVTGILSVTLKEGASADSLLHSPDLRVRDSFPEIRTYFVTAAKEPFDLQSLKNFLQSEFPVERVELEVLSRQYEKY